MSARRKPDPAHADNELLKQVMAYRNPEVVERFKRELQLNQRQAKILFDDVKRFLFLCATTVEVQSPTEKIDEGWHEFLMFTRDYQEFCTRYFGRFIHHAPTPTLRPHAVCEPSKTVEAAKLRFGTLSPNWDASDARCGKCGDPTCSGTTNCQNT